MSKVEEGSKRRSVGVVTDIDTKAYIGRQSRQRKKAKVQCGR